MKSLRSSASLAVLVFALSVSGGAKSFAAIQSIGGANGADGISGAPNGANGEDAAYNPTGDIRDSIYVYGGNGGNAPVYSETGNGGNGGIATLNGVLSLGNYGGYWPSGTYQAKGGNGGSGNGTGAKGGNGSTAQAVMDITVDSANTTPSTFMLTQQGGNGGQGYDGAAGGDGADSIMIDALRVTTPNAKILKQIAVGGDAGAAIDSDAAQGKAGRAISRLTTLENQSYITVQQVAAEGGNGASNATPSSTIGTEGGAAEAFNKIVTTNRSGSPWWIGNNTTSALGGRGGYGAKGGDATAIFDSESLAEGSGYIYASGGEGGAGWGQGSGDGGNATASGSVKVAKSESNTATGSLEIIANGGHAGNSFGTPEARTGNGGTATATAFGQTDLSVTNATLHIGASQVGGNGGQGYDDQAGGHGANSVMNNAISGLTAGQLTLIQNAQGGAGGYSESAQGGNGGQAEATLNITDSTARSISARNEARGGSAGSSSSTSSGTAGDAKATTTVTSTAGASLNLSALSIAGGLGMYDYANSEGGNGATADATTIGQSGNEVTSAATSFGGDGQTAWGSGKKAGTGGKANVSAYAESTNGNRVSALAEAHQGNGGTGANGADGGDGLGVLLSNAAGGATTGEVSLEQRGYAGRGGNSDSGAAGTAGNAATLFTINDTQASSFLTSNIALAGDGGNGANGTQSSKGGDASALSDIQTAGTAGDGPIWSSRRNYVLSYGGNGGQNQNGGNALSSLNLAATSRGAGSVEARGGSGNGNADGGTATAQGSLLLKQDSNAYTYGGLSALAVGGNGAGSGNGGTATASASAAGLGTNYSNALALDVAQYGGNGGNALYNGNAGNGAHSALTNAVSGTTTGILSLRQSAYGGHGGFADDGLGGTGGSASSILTLNDDKAREIDLFLSASGGTAGAASQDDTGRAGEAVVDANVTATAQRLDIRALGVGGNNHQGYGYANKIGHEGGNATVQARGVTTGDASVYAEAVAGDGLTANGNGQKAGQGGTAEANAYAESQNGGAAKATVYHRAGNGGTGYNGANGGDGVTAALLNRVDALTTGLKHLVQVAFGGAGGASQSGHAGAAGSAISTLDFEDNTAQTIQIQNETRAGAGANGALASTQGGDALSQTFVRSTSAKLGQSSGNQAQTLATGGTGGYGEKGGTARAEVNASVVNHAWTNTFATGGAGGDGQHPSYEGNKNGGQGGDSEAFGALALEGPAATDGLGASSHMNLSAIGGNGGVGNGTGNRGGDGGTAAASGIFIVADESNAENLSMVLTQQGGHGGRGAYGADAGNGASSALNNALTARTSGNINLRQIAIGGDGGWTDAATSETGLGKSGMAGQASSLLSVVDSQASKLDLATESYGGKAYKPMNTAYTAPLAGSAFAATNAFSTRLGTQVKAEATATSGTLATPWSYLPSNGLALAHSSARGLGLNTPILAIAKATGGVGEASSQSRLDNGLGDTIQTFAKAGITKAGTTASASTGALSGYDNGWDYMPKSYETTVSFGNILPKDMNGNDVKRTNLGGATADFTTVAEGRMGANLYTNPNDDGDVATGNYTMSASYSFANLATGRDLLFGVTGADRWNGGFDSLSFSLTQDGNQLISKTFTDYGSFESFFNAPLNLGSISGTTNLVVSMSQILTGVKDYSSPWTGYIANYAFVSAITGTVMGMQQHVSNVPLPATLPLFGTALAGLGLIRKRKQTKKS